MSFISYAQNFEDVMLWRAFKDVEKGFYIDIGAQDPLVDSVSMAFYEHGWRGCHIEPTTQYSTKLRQARPDEMVLQLAIGHEQGLLSFFEFADTGLSTSDREIAFSHKERGFDFQETTVPVISLDDLLEKFSDREIHWLKVDVEGAEKSVLLSWKHALVRPWILIIESTIPLTQIESHSDWEWLVKEKGYEFVYFDGLNRFYVSSEHRELGNGFSTPPNIFDGFELSGLASQTFCRHVERLFEIKTQQAEARAGEAEARAGEAEARAGEAEARARVAEVQAGVAEARAGEAESRAARADKAVFEVLNSSSWKITYPVRVFAEKLRWLVRGSISWLTFAPGCRPRRLVRSCLVSLKEAIKNQPRIREFLLGRLQRFPRLKAMLFQIGIPEHQVAESAQRGLEKASITESARYVYQDLLDARMVSANKIKNQ